MGCAAVAAAQSAIEISSEQMSAYIKVGNG